MPMTILRRLPLLAFALVWAASAAAAPIISYALGPRLEARVDENGTVALGWQAGGTWHALLTAAAPDAGATDARGGAMRVFSRVAGEGAPNGQRGFGRRADDDGDTAFDEDRLDGLDNDGDGKVDEDFAGISDFMGVVDRTRDGRGLHLETYHWSYPNLRTIVAVSLQPIGLDVDGTDTWTVTLATGAWMPTSRLCRHGRAEGPALLARMADPRTSPGDLWFGVAVLHDVDTDRPRMRLHRQEGRIDIPLPADGCVLILSAGPTETQVATDLREAREVWRGAVDPVSGKRMAWLPPPRPAEVPEARIPDAEITQRADGGLDVTFHVAPGQDPRFDPQLLVLDGHPLGSPREVAWRTVGDTARAMPWDDGPEVPTESVGPDPCGPFSDLMPAGLARESGTLVLVFAAAGERSLAPVSRLDLTYADGRHASRAGVPVTFATAAPPRDDGAAPAEGGPQLAPALLGNFPNPFHVQTRVQYRVPATVGEGFVWPEGAEPALAADARIPYRTETPSVSVRIFGVDGREIVTLGAGPHAVGRYEAEWDGRDAEGRLLASGTYFCKLQIENWSVTKRLVFVR